MFITFIIGIYLLAKTSNIIDNCSYVPRCLGSEILDHDQFKEKLYTRH